MGVGLRAGPFFNLTFGMISYKLTTMEKVIIYTSSNSISCMGEEEVGSHPIVYHYISKDAPEEVCGYCSVIFRFDKDAERKTQSP